MNSTTLPRPGQGREVDWLYRDDLDAAERTLIQILQREARKHGECWRGNDYLVKAVGRSIRWVQQRLRRFADLGFIRIIRDHTLKTRRRIALLWRAETPAEPVPETPAPEEPMNALRAALPPEPEAVAQPAAARKATPEEVAGLLKAAAEVQGSTPEKAKALARTCGLHVVEAASRRAAAKGMGWGWVVRTAPAWKVEGVPDYAEADAGPRESLREQIAALFGPGGRFEKPSFDMSPYAHIKTWED